MCRYRFDGCFYGQDPASVVRWNFSDKHQLSPCLYAISRSFLVQLFRNWHRMCRILCCGLSNTLVLYENCCFATTSPSRSLDSLNHMCDTRHVATFLRSCYRLCCPRVPFKICSRSCLSDVCWLLRAIRNIDNRADVSCACFSPATLQCHHNPGRSRPGRCHRCTD